MIDNGQRNEHCPAPRRHFVNVKRRPARQEHYLQRYRRQIFPWEHTKQCEVKLAERVHLRNPAQAHYGRARFMHERRIHRTTGKLQSKIGLHGRVNFARSPVINVPAAVGQLAFKNVTDATPLQLRVHFAAPVHEDDVVGAQRAIDQQLAAPLPVGFLLSQKIFLSQRNRPPDFFVRRRIRLRGFGRTW